jgi:hypothetical protein
VNLLSKSRSTDYLTLASYSFSTQLFKLQDPQVSKMPTSYEILGVKTSSSLAEVKATYKELALKYHPDKNHGNEEEAHRDFVRIKDSYDRIIKRFERQARVEEDSFIKSSPRKEKSKHSNGSNSPELNTKRPPPPPPPNKPRRPPPPKPSQPPPFCNDALLQDWPTRHTHKTLPTAASLPSDPIPSLPIHTIVFTMQSDYIDQLNDLRDLASQLRCTLEPGNFFNPYPSPAMAVATQNIIAWIKAEKRMVTSLYADLEASCWWISPRHGLSKAFVGNIARRQTSWFLDTILSEEVRNGLKAREMWVQVAVTSLEGVTDFDGKMVERFLMKCREYFPGEEKEEVEPKVTEGKSSETLS